MEIQKSQKPWQINYQYLDGMKGFGALSVVFYHFQHFRNNEKIFLSEDPQFKGVFRFIVDGQFWVQVFFILSGFVLPISFLKSGKHQSVFGSVFRRYIRLLFPIWMVHTVRYFAIETLWRNRWFVGGCSHELKDMYMTTFFTVWFGDSSWNNPEWTISVELWGSFFVLLAMITLNEYKNRYVLYGVVMTFLVMSQWRQKGVDYTEPKNQSNLFYMFLFMVGLFLSDLENARDWGVNHEQRPLELIRKNSYVRIPVCTLCLITVWYCNNQVSDNQPKSWGKGFGATALIIFGLISPLAKKLFETPICKFLGRVSFSLYLSHLITMHWLWEDIRNFMFNDLQIKTPRIEVELMMMLPFLLLPAYLLDQFVDIPCKDFTHELDQQLRIAGKSQVTTFEFLINNKFFQCISAIQIGTPLLVWIIQLTEFDKLYETNKTVKYTVIFIITMTMIIVSLINHFSSYFKQESTKPILQKNITTVDGNIKGYNNICQEDTEVISSQSSSVQQRKNTLQKSEMVK